ncbi:MAG: MarR family winged helix-turn-helix transcriptional regulator [Acidiphilium sp.]
MSDSTPAETARAQALAAELRTVMGKLKRKLREQAHPGDFTMSQLSVLSRLDREGPATVTALARAEGMRPQSMGSIVAALEEAGLIAGAPNPDDGRQTILSLTPACRERIRAGRAAWDDWLFHAIQQNLAPAEQDDLARAVELLERIVDARLP